MKKLLFFFIISIAAGRVYAQNAKELAKEFLDRYNELSDGSYREANKARLVLRDGFIKYDVQPIAGTDHSIMNANAAGLQYELTVYRTHPHCEKACKEIVKAMEIIGKMKGYQFITIDKDLSILYKGPDQIMDYTHEQYVDIYPNDYAHISIAAGIPYTEFLADESKYSKGFPTELSNSPSPQIIERKDKDKNRSFIMNGLFVDKKLTAGSMRLINYDKFMNGTWLNRMWDYDDKTRYVCFIPEGTTDSISGYIAGLNFSTFRPSPRYFDGLKAAKNSPPWVSNQYMPFKKEMEEMAQKGYEDEERKRHSLTSDQLDAQVKMYQDRDVRGRTGSSGTGSSGSSEKISSFSTCSVCGGHGYTVYDCGQGGGHPCRKTCTACNGTGSVHN